MFIIQNILWRVDRINEVKKFLRMLGQKARKKITKSQMEKDKQVKNLYRPLQSNLQSVFYATN